MSCSHCKNAIIIAMIATMLFAVDTHAAPSVKRTKGNAWQKEHDLIVNSISSYLDNYLNTTHTPAIKGLPAWVKQSDFDIPITYNKYVKLYLDYFSGPGRWFFQKWLQRSARYFPIIHNQLKQKNMPQDLAYIAMIESGLSMSAYSRAGAAGPWQFMRVSAKRFHLKVNWQIDERMDLFKSTNAASQYLRILYDEFNDWYLAWAAYNAGEGKMRNAIKRYNTRSFWRMIEKGNYLRVETKHYVAKIIAAAIIHKYPQRYGFTIPKITNPVHIAHLNVSKPIHLKRLARTMGVSYQVIREFNRAYRQHHIPHGSRYALHVPHHLVQVAQQAIQKTTRVAQAKSNFTYTVKPGDSLYKIANTIGTDVSELQKLNNLKDSRIYVGQKLRVTRQLLKSIVHKVHYGDTLWSIAKKYSVSVKQLKNWNNLQKNKIHVGQKIKILQQTIASNKKLIVKAGDSLWKLAQDNSTTVSKLLANNQHLDPQKPLLVGTVITID